MASYHVKVNHDLDRAAARARVEQFLEQVQRDYAAHVSDVSGEWQEDELHFRFRTTGLAISGRLLVEETVVEVTGPLPLLAAMFRGRIEKTIHDELSKLLA